MIRLATTTTRRRRIESQLCPGPLERVSASAAFEVDDVVDDVLYSITVDRSADFKTERHHHFPNKLSRELAQLPSRSALSASRGLRIHVL